MEPVIPHSFLLPNSERECADRLAELRWGPEGPICGCNCRRFGRLEPRPRVFVCRQCNRHKSVTAGTLLHGCHVSLKHWFLASMLLNRVGGCSARELQDRIDVSYETAWQLLHRLRTAVSGPNPVLSGRLTQGCIGIATSRPYRCGSGPRGRNRSTIAGLMGNGVGLFEQVPEESDVDEWAARHTDEEPEDAHRSGALRVSLRLLRWQVARTHSGVSERWLGRYAGEHRHRQNQKPSTFLRASICGPRRRFVEVRPDFEPTWRSGFS